MGAEYALSTLLPVKDENYFSDKGKNAELFLHEKISKVFLSNWVFLNPKLPNGKELCDFLIVYDDIIIIWQTKDIKIDAEGMYNKKSVEKNFRQLAGAKRQLYELKTSMALENVHRNIKNINISSYKKTYLISTFTGSEQVFIDPIEELKSHAIHVFTETAILTLLTELDTVNDFLNYLIEREKLFLTEKSFNTIISTEEDLLGYYLINNRKLIQNEGESTGVIATDIWQKFSTSKAYLDRKNSNKTSYFWDSLIDETKGKQEDAENYEKIAREMARLDREERGYLSKCFLEAKCNAINRKSFRRLLSYNGVTYCFLFQNETSEIGYRLKVL